jgi:hypothetical protein
VGVGSVGRTVRAVGAGAGTFGVLRLRVSRGAQPTPLRMTANTRCEAISYRGVFRRWIWLG